MTEPSPDMLARVTRILSDFMGFGADHIDHDHAARQIIAAMREPTIEMVLAGRDPIVDAIFDDRISEDDGVCNVWHAMIDAAVGSGAKP